jgi:hypothetical protein
LLQKKEKEGKRERELIFYLYLFMVAVLVVHFLLGLLLEFLHFVVILHLCTLVAVLVADYHHLEFHMMVGLLGLF